MSTIETWVASAPTARERPETQGLLEQSIRTCKEMPGIFKGLIGPANMFWRQLAVVAVLNAAIAAWAFFQPYVVELNVDALLKNGAVYSEVAWTIGWSFLLVTLINAVLLPFMRGYYTLWFLRPQFKRRISLQCVRYQLSLPKAARKKEFARGPVIQDGRNAAFEMLEFFTREPFQIARGIGTLVFLATISYTLTAIVVVSIFIDGYVTARMKNRTEGPQSDLRDVKFRLEGLENDMLGNGTIDREKFKEYRDEWKIYIKAIRDAEGPWLIYDTFWRGVPAKVLHVGTTLILAWWVYTGQISFGKFGAYLMYVEVANNPFEIFFNFIWKMVSMREELRRFGILSGIDFGLKPLKKTIPAR